jgi:predicted transcriptional regulator
MTDLIARHRYTPTKSEQRTLLILARLGKATKYDLSKKDPKLSYSTVFVSIERLRKRGLVRMVRRAKGMRGSEKYIYQPTLTGLIYSMGIPESETFLDEIAEANRGLWSAPADLLKVLQGRYHPLAREVISKLCRAYFTVPESLVELGRDLLPSVPKEEWESTEKPSTTRVHPITRTALEFLELQLFYYLLLGAAIQFKPEESTLTELMGRIRSNPKLADRICHMLSEQAQNMAYAARGLHQLARWIREGEISEIPKKEGERNAPD